MSSKKKSRSVSAAVIDNNTSGVKSPGCLICCLITVFVLIIACIFVTLWFSVGAIHNLCVDNIEMPV